MHDNEILDLYWARSEAAVSATAEKYGSYCYSISYNILHNSQDAEECVNDTYWNAWRSIPPQRPVSLGAYLGRITRNLALNCLCACSAEKRGGGQGELVLAELEDCIPSGTNVEQAAEEAELVSAIEGFLRAQPKQKRHIFVRRYWYASPIQSIAAAYGMSESKVASLLFRMRKELKKHLEKEGIAI